MSDKALPVGHPVRELLRAATTYDLTRNDLQRLHEWDEHLPPGSSLSRLRVEVSTAAREIRALGQQGRHHEARQLADQYTARIGGGMDQHEAAATGDLHPEDVDTIAARMFGHN